MDDNNNKTTVDIPRTVGSCFGGCFGWFAILFLVGGALYVLTDGPLGSLSGGVVLWGVIIGVMIFYGGKEVYRWWNRVS